MNPTTAKEPPQSHAGNNFLDKLFAYGGITLCILVSALAFMLPARFRPNTADANVASPTTIQRHLGDFSLTNCDGQTVQRSDLAGKFLIVNFVFTGCSLSCLQVNYRMAEIQQLIAGQDDVRLVSLTVDPLSDTPQTLATFAQRFQADANRWLFLTGEKLVLYPLIEKSFLGPGQPNVGGVPGGFINTDLIALVDQRGEIRAMFKGLKSSVAREVTDKLAALRKETLPP